MQSSRHREVTEGRYRPARSASGGTSWAELSRGRGPLIGQRVPDRGHGEVMGELTISRAAGGDLTMTGSGERSKVNAKVRCLDACVVRQVSAPCTLNAGFRVLSS